jgi:iron complex transport system ATP-binding protein
MSAPNPAISLKSVSFSYGSPGERFMEGISLEIHRSGICALLGPNGSGKTTLLNLVLGMLTPREGVIEVCGYTRFSGRRMPKHLVGLVPQEESIPFDLSVFEYVLLGRAPHLGILEQPGSLDRDIAIEALRTVGIEGLKNRSVPSLSGGERQLAMVARVLVQESSILLMDEPTSHLDLGNTRRVLDLMRALRAAGKTVVFSTHDANAATALADQVVLMKRGDILCSGSPTEVLTPGNLGELYGIEVEVVRLRGRPLVVIE